MDRKRTFLIWVIVSSLTLIAHLIFSIFKFNRLVDTTSHYLFFLVTVIAIASTVKATIRTKSGESISSILDWTMFLSRSISLMLFVIIHFVMVARVEGQSMMTTYHDRDVILVYQLDYTPKTNDVAIIHVIEPNDDSLYVKRVVGIPGSKITFVGSNNIFEVYVNDVLYKSPDGDTYTLDVFDKMRLENQLDNHIVPEGFYFVLGDNAKPGESRDSRSLGLIPIEDIVGKVLIRIIKGD